jgi:hypothetical protein
MLLLYSQNEGIDMMNQEMSSVSHVLNRLMGGVTRIGTYSARRLE